MNKVDDFVAGFISGYYGIECPDDASEEFKSAYARGYETSERESAVSEYMERRK